MLKCTHFTFLASPLPREPDRVRFRKRILSAIFDEIKNIMSKIQTNTQNFRTKFQEDSPHDLLYNFLQQIVQHFKIHNVRFHAAFPTRFFHNNFPQDFPARISHKIFPPEFPARFSCKNFPQLFPARI